MEALAEQNPPQLVQDPFEGRALLLQSRSLRHMGLALIGSQWSVETRTTPRTHQASLNAFNEKSIVNDGLLVLEQANSFVAGENTYWVSRGRTLVKPCRETVCDTI